MRPCHAVKFERFIEGDGVDKSGVSDFRPQVRDKYTSNPAWNVGNYSTSPIGFDLFILLHSVLACLLFMLHI
jgi:hypothetical protein